MLCDFSSDIVGRVGTSISADETSMDSAEARVALQASSTLSVISQTAVQRQQSSSSDVVDVAFLLDIDTNYARPMSTAMSRGMVYAELTSMTALTS